MEENQQEPESITPRFPSVPILPLPTLQDLDAFNERILSVAQVVEMMEDAFSMACNLLASTDPADENSIVTPTLIIAVWTGKDRWRSDIHAMFTTQEDTYKGYELAGRRYDQTKEIVIGMAHFSEVWVADASTVPQGKRPSDSASRREGIAVTGATMKAQLLGWSLTFDRDADRKPVFDRAKVDKGISVARMPRHFRHFMNGYCGR